MTTAAASEPYVDPGAPAGDRWPAGERAAPRLDASLVPSITGVRIPPGDAPVRLLNISNTGALVECEHRLKPGTEVTLHFAGTFKPSTVRARVARSNVCGIGTTGALVYQIGVAFLASIELPNSPAPTHAKPTAGGPSLPARAPAPAAASPVPPEVPANAAAPVKAKAAAQPAHAAPAQVPAKAPVQASAQPPVQAPVPPPPAAPAPTTLRNRW
jgi:hypothetical protein